MHDLKNISEECIRELKAIDIPIQDDKIREIVAVPLDKDGCEGHCVITGDGGFRIEIWQEMLNDNIINPVILKSITCHELTHTCEGCMNHCGKFRRYLKKIDEFYHYGMMIMYDDYMHPNEQVLDKLQCTKCGFIQLFRKKANSKNIRDARSLSPDLLPRCPYCGGKTIHTLIK